MTSLTVSLGLYFERLWDFPRKQREGLSIEGVEVLLSLKD